MACGLQEQAGLFFDLSYRENYKVVKYNQAEVDTTYILYQCGTDKPDDQFTQGLNASKTAFVEIPVTAVATGDSTAAWMLVRHCYESPCASQVVQDTRPQCAHCF